MLMTKITTHNVPEFKMFETMEEEEAYWDEICPICNNRDCNDDCIFMVAGLIDCDDCNGKGLIKFVHRPSGDDLDAYYIITSCGMCNGIGLV
jgi:hypothetical protein